MTSTRQVCSSSKLCAPHRQTRTGQHNKDLRLLQQKINVSDCSNQVIIFGLFKMDHMQHGQHTWERLTVILATSHIYTEVEGRSDRCRRREHEAWQERNEAQPVESSTQEACSPRSHRKDLRKFIPQHQTAPAVDARKKSYERRPFQIACIQQYQKRYSSRNDHAHL